MSDWMSAFGDTVTSGMEWLDDAGLWDAAAGGAVGAGLAWATDNDIAMGAGIGAVGGFLTSDGQYAPTIFGGKFDLTDMLLGTSGAQLSAGAPAQTVFDPVTGKATKLAAVAPTFAEGTSGLLANENLQKYGASFIVGKAAADAREAETNKILDFKKAESDAARAGRRITGIGSDPSEGLPSSMLNSRPFKRG